MIGSKKLATGWKEEITDAVHYLNVVHYGFFVIDQKDISQGENPNQALRKY